MCNAKTIRKSRDEMNTLFQGLKVELENELPPDLMLPRYRIGPKQRHVIYKSVSEYSAEAVMASWDLIPSGTFKPFLRTNARADGLKTTWPWKQLVKVRRCIVPADGFFEPEKPALSKEVVPWSFYELKDQGLFWMPGLWNETVVHPQAARSAAVNSVPTDTTVQSSKWFAGLLSDETP